MKLSMIVGDALFFHSNLLHTSGPNNSDLRRWAFLVAYNTKANNPVIPHHHPQYTPLEKVTCHPFSSQFITKFFNSTRKFRFISSNFGYRVMNS